MAVMLFPVIGPLAPPVPPDVSGLAGALIKETLIGLLIGSIMRFIVACWLSTRRPIASNV